MAPSFGIGAFSFLERKTMIEQANLPLRIRSSPRFCGTRITIIDGKKKKPPYSIITGELFSDVWNPSQKELSTFEQALASESNYDYLGYVVSRSQHIVADLDHCFNEEPHSSACA